MGEISRTIGILGENIVDNFLKLIGWNGISNLEFQCKSKKNHQKRSHDIDFFTAYKCPLENDTLENVFVSTKYRKLPANKKSAFIEYAKSIVDSSECFKFDVNYRSLTENFICKKKKYSHVLFWLNHSESENKSLLEYIGNIGPELKFDFEFIYLIDNNRISFIYHAIKFAKNLYANSQIEFVYHRTGINVPIEGGRKLSGSILPVQYINSSVLPIRITFKDSKNKILLLALNESFEEDSLRRLMGLSQNLTEGWCNKIIICFPDYQTKDHEIIKDSVMMNFAISKFSDLVEVKSFSESFKTLEKVESKDFQDHELEIPEFNIETMLPFGDQMRQLINQSYIYKSDLQLLLSKRGTFINNSNTKESLTPYFAKTLISPREFEFLRRKQSTKENADKIISQDIIVKQKTDIKNTLTNLEIPLHQIIENKILNCELVSNTPFILENNGEHRLKFKIKRQDLTRDWAKPKSIHSGEIVVRQINNEKDGYNKIQIDLISTSRETKQLDKEIVNFILSELKQQGHVPKHTQPEKMLAQALTNNQRTQFLFSFINLTKEDTDKFSFFEITDVKFKPDSSKELPDDIDSLKNRVEHQILTGRNLEEIMYIKDMKYRELFIFTSLTVEYNFAYNDTKGKFKIEYGYPDFTGRKDDKSEFEYKILEIIPSMEKNLSTKEYHNIGLFLKEEFNRIKNSKYEKIKPKYGKQLMLDIS